MNETEIEIRKHYYGQSLLNRWREWWRTHPANPRTWTKEDWIKDREVMRIVSSFTIGLFLGPLSFGIPPFTWVLIPFVLVFLALAERDYMKTIRSFDNEG